MEMTREVTAECENDVDEEVPPETEANEDGERRSDPGADWVYGRLDCLYCYRD